MGVNDLGTLMSVATHVYCCSEHVEVETLLDRVVLDDEYEPPLELKKLTWTCLRKYRRLRVMKKSAKSKKKGVSTEVRSCGLMWFAYHQTINTFRF